MKKTLSLLLALLLALGMTPVFAEDAADALSWWDVYPDVEALGFAGDYYTLDGVGVAFWIPASLHPLETDATYEDTLALAAFETVYGDKALVICFYPLEEENAGETPEGTSLTINGIPAYAVTAEDCFSVCFSAEGGYVLAFNFYPADDYVFSAMARVIASSVQPYSGAEE